MAILTNKPASVNPGVASSAITLSRSTLISQMGITGYFATSTNWNRISFVMRDATGAEQVGMFFGASNTTTWGVSSTARQNTWQCVYIIIYDFDNGTYVIPRSSFTSATEFDIAVTPAVPTTSLRPERTSSWSISTWFKPGSSTGTVNTIFANVQDDGGGGIQIYQFNGRISVQNTTVSGTSFLNVDWAAAGMTSGVWSHVVMTYNGNTLNTGFKLYVNGTLISQSGSSGSLSTGTLIGTGPVWLGNYHAAIPSPVDYPINGGSLDEFAFYSAALSAGDVTAIYNSGVPQDISTLASFTNAVAWYRFEAGLSPADTYNGTIYDRVDMQHNGTPTGLGSGFIAVNSPGGTFSVDSGLFNGTTTYVQLIP